MTPHANAAPRVTGRPAGFTLLEMIVTVLLGAFIVLIVAGTLQNTIRAWTTVQERVSENYNHRMVLDLIRRQTSSLFFRADADRLNRQRGVNPNRRVNRRDNQRRGNNRQPQPPTPSPAQGYQLPEGSHFFLGTPQELNFLSTVSFLSDFPGQVAVRYYVVQGEPGEDEDWDTLPSSRTQASAGGAFGDPTPVDPDSGFIPDFPPPLEGNLYLFLEETNLFLSQTQMQNSEDPTLINDPNMQPVQPQPGTGDGNLSGEGEDGTKVMGRSSMRLIGPLRAFTLRYRRPLARGAQEMDTEEDWAEYWDLTMEGRYPSAVEFIFFYEEPGITDDIPTEELPGIRMVLPVYDTNNLIRGGGTRVPF